MSQHGRIRDTSPTWYKDAIIYEVYIRAFRDSNGDGVGDLNGLTEKLDYLEDLGVTAIWLLPFYPSPLRDGGYDIADYRSIHPSYGTIRDFNRFLREAHRRGINVITELVLNHTSSEHAWFQRARKARPGSRWRNYYVWSDTPNRYKDARIIFKDFETSNWTWDSVAKAYYWHRFYAHQPDLNFDNPEVQAAMLSVVDFWMDAGVDGLRLDAVPYLFERDGTTCENLPETHGFLRQLRAHIDAKYQGRMLLAEANQWPADAAAYFGNGDECHMNFHFPLMPRMFMAVELEDSFPIVNILHQTPKLPSTCQWATFLRNHDELTLEMVTDEDRDYMVRTYAKDRSARINLGIRRRLAPLLEERRKIELMTALLLALPGTPVLYYGDEIGMGDNIYLGDRDGVRTPMQWTSDANAGFSRAKPQQLYLPVNIDADYHYQAVNVETQQANTSSLLWWTKRAIALRKQFNVFGRGSIDFLHPENGRVVAFLREYEGTLVLVVTNLSRFAQFVELDLGRFQGRIPIELFGRTRFPTITDRPYTITLAPYAFFWFALEMPPVEGKTAAEPPVMHTQKTWRGLLEANRRPELARVLLQYTTECRWSRGKSRTIDRAAIRDVLQVSPRDAEARHAGIVLEVIYAEGATETYFVPIGFAEGPMADEMYRLRPKSIIARVAIAERPGRDGILFDALTDARFSEALLAKIIGRKSLVGERGQLLGVPFKTLKSMPKSGDLVARPLNTDPNNRAIVFGDRFIMKIVRLMEEGPSVESEMGRFLSSARGPLAIPKFAGTLEYRARGGDTYFVGILQEFIPNSGDAFRLTLDSLDRFFDRILSTDVHYQLPPELPRSPLDPIDNHLRASLADLMGPHYERVQLLGTRTAELHLALGHELEDPAFAPEPFTMMHQQSLYQSAQNVLARTFAILRQHLSSLPENTRALATMTLEREQAVLNRLNAVNGRMIQVDRIRCPGNFHLGKVLWMGTDFVFIDFDGEAARPRSERRYKRCPLRDVAEMLRSFHYAAAKALRSGRVRPDDIKRLEPWTRAWIRLMSSAYVEAYVAKAGSPSFLPKLQQDRSTLLAFYTLEKCINDVAYELHNHSDGLEIALGGLLELMEGTT
ncbi:MAG TPA: maltose alpha-D-glucosyltransferase [Polyangium sp.]|nr:maltose alpha-D-glucosyltransferase [Polyangium sp.]